MNVFALDDNPVTAAHYHCDDHAKMALEGAQMLSTAVGVFTDSYDLVPARKGVKKKWRKAAPDLYVPTHPNHPSAVWVRESIENAAWLAVLVTTLSYEMTWRRNRPVYEGCRDVARKCVREFGHLWPSVRRTPFSIAIDPMKYPTVVQRVDDPIQTYRDYYVAKNAMWKKPMTWTNRGKPPWWPEERKHDSISNTVQP